MEETRNKIVSYASAVFVKEGCYRVTMGDIAAGLHISKKTLYEHFANKEELIRECVQTMHGKLQAQMHEVSQQISDPLYMILFYTNAMLQSSRRMSKLLRDMLQYYPETLHEQMKPMTDTQFDFIRSALEQAQLKGQLRDEIQLDVVMQSLKMSTMRIQTTPLDTFSQDCDNNIDYVAVIVESCFSFFRGLLTVEAIEHYDHEMRNYKDLFMNL